jgi:hypothetical protein
MTAYAVVDGLRVAYREAGRWPDRVEVTVPGLHLLPEDSSGPIADALSEWLGTLEP